MRVTLHSLFLIVIFIVFGCSSNLPQTKADSDHNVDQNSNNDLSIVAESARLWTGVAVSDDDRIFVNYPRWSTEFSVSVAEISDSGEEVPYPNEEWNTWKFGEDHQGKFVCVQSVYFHNGSLWILDSGNPYLQGVIDQAAKLVQVDLATDQIVNIFYFVSIHLYESQVIIEGLRPV